MKGHGDEIAPIISELIGIKVPSERIRYGELSGVRGGLGRVFLLCSLIIAPTKIKNFACGSRVLCGNDGVVLDV